MKIINSPVRNVVPDTMKSDAPYGWSLARKAKAIADAKTIARRRERALLRPLVAKELLQERLADMAEKREADRIEREMAYSIFMRKVKRSSRRHAESLRKAAAKEAMATACGESRVAFRVERIAENGERVSALLASCALQD